MHRERGQGVSTATAAALEFPTALRLVAVYAETDVGAKKVAGLNPARTLPQALETLERTMEAERLLEEGSLVPTFSEPLLPLFSRLESDRQGVEGSDLVGFGALLRTTLRASRRIVAADPPCAALAELAGRLPEIEGLRDLLDRTLDSRGRVKESASQRLAALAARSRTLRQRLYDNLGKLVLRHREDLAEETIPLHGERLVLLLRSGSKGRLRGIVHGRSATGKSFYFEPLEVVEANNELQDTREDEQAERARIFRQLVDRVFEERQALAAHLDFLGELDFRQAAVRFGAACESCLVCPGPEPGLEMVEARHPLLDPRLASLRERALGQSGHDEAVVPLTLDLSEDERILVVTGPNAGGKTVALKTVGLLVLMAHCGLPIPAKTGTRFPFFRRIVATVGDEQDLLADRSTFSGRLLRLREAWEAAGPGSLVLLDELGSGTDPEEGAALGVALLEGLLDKRSWAVITSHLTRLSAAALERPGAACAAMEFDADSGQPTYRLLAGTPGSSEALALARRLGLPKEWVSRAEELLGPGHQNLQQLLAEAEGVRRQLATELEQVRSERRKLDATREELTAAEQRLDEERALLSRRLRQELQAFRRKVRDQLRDELVRMKDSLQEGRRRGLVDESLDRLFRDAPEHRDHESPGEEIKPGSLVRHRSFGWQGTVSRIDRGDAIVLVRGKRLRSSLEALEGLAEKPPVEATRTVTEVSRSEEAVAPELKLLGRRVEAALEELDGYLDRAMLSALERVRIIHGHGTGRLKEAVRRHVGSHPAVERWQVAGAKEGGDGATIVFLKV
jgi:DNA mismatch repair protein MutS2